jgi:hypothetical protein
MMPNPRSLVRVVDLKVLVGRLSTECHQEESPSMCVWLGSSDQAPGRIDPVPVVTNIFGDASGGCLLQQIGGDDEDDPAKRT